MNTTKPADDQNISPPTRNVSEVLADGIGQMGIICAVVITLLCAGFAGGTASSVGNFFMITTTAVSLVLAGACVGGILGLLFGMPRQSENTGAESTHARYEFNSNLLKVSDWVTTIIVGLSLVSLRSVPGALDGFSEWVAPSLGAARSSGPFAVFIAATGFAVTFMILYIWTTVPLRSHLENEAFDTEQQWASLVGQVAAQRTPEEISEALKTLTPAALDQIQTDSDRTPPLLRELAAKEQSRRAADDPNGSDDRERE